MTEYYDCNCGTETGDHDFDCACLTPKLKMDGHLTCFSLRPGEKMVRVSVQIVEQLTAAPSQPVTLQIEDRGGEELQFILTRHDCPSAPLSGLAAAAAPSGPEAVSPPASVPKVNLPENGRGR